MSEDFYSPVQRRIWNDAGFRKLSRPSPNARDLFLYLLTTPRATQVPGLIALGESAMAEDLGWPAAGLRKALVEVEAAGMVKVDRDARLLWLPNGLRHNPPRSPDNVKGWAKQWRMLPECSLLREAAESMMGAFVVRGPTFASAFARVSGLPMPEAEPAPKPDPTPRPMVSPKPEPSPAHQHQDQDQQQDQQSTHIVRAPAREAQDEDDARIRPPPCSEADLAAVLRELPALADLADDPDMLTDLHSGFAMACGDAATEGLARGALGALVGAENLRDMPPWKRRERAGRYLGNARKYDAGSPRGSEPARVTDDQRVVLTVFGEEWKARKKRDFVQSAGDEKHAAAIVEAAWEHAGRLKIRPRDVVRHWCKGYLSDGDKFVADREHPLSLLPTRLTSYGLPPKKPAPAREKPAATETLVTIPREIATAMTQAPLEGLSMRRPGGPS